MLHAVSPPQRFRYPQHALRRFSAMEIRMGNHQDPPDAVIEEVASVLATGYLRMRNARTLKESGEDPGEGLDSVAHPSPHGAVS